MTKHPASHETPTQEPGASKARRGFLTWSLKGERLARRVPLMFGFLSFIPLLLILLAFQSFVVPHVSQDVTDILRLMLMGIIGSIFIGYFVLKRTIGAMIEVANRARTVTQQMGGTFDGEGDEIVELARTFNRVTHELEHKIEELEMSRGLIKQLLSRIGPALVSYEGIDNLLNLIVENIVLSLEAQMGSLLLINGQTQELEMKTAWSAQGQAMMPTRMKLGEGIAGWVAREHRAMRSTGVPASVGLPSGPSQDGAVLSMPLLIREKTIGVISVWRQDPRRVFSEDDEVLVVNIAAQIAVVIENYRLNLDVERTYLETITALAMAVEAKDPYSAGHSKRVGHYSRRIAQEFGLDDDTQKIIQEAGVLHDVGKIGVKDEILLKASALTEEELRVMRQHPVIGEAILKPVRSLGKISDVIRYHHEFYDGSGYPFHLKGEDIPLMARILTVADTYDAMVTDRPYRKRLSLDQAKAELQKCAGTQFDPQVVEAFLRVLAEKEARQGSPEPS